MKRILFLIVISLITGLTVHAQGYGLTVYGNVMQESNNTITPVPNHPVKVILNDSVNGGVFTYQNTVYTDVSGYYEDIVLIPPAIGYLYVEVMTYDSCSGDYQYNGALWAQGTALPSLDFFLCTGVPPGGCENYFLYYYNDPMTITFEGYLYNGQQASSYAWDFGDSTYASGQTVTHTYLENPNGIGVYLVSLTTTFTDSMGVSCTAISMMEVWVTGQSDCFASFFYFPDSTNDLTLQFVDMSFTFNGGIPTSWLWDFGDGGFSYEQNPVHTYADTGSYVVCLTIEDSLGNCTNTYCEEVFTGFPPPPGGCENFFFFEQTDSSTFIFTGEAYLNNGTTSSETTYFWDFGDGTTGTGQVITHYFQPNPVNDFYTVCLETHTILPGGDSCTAYSCQEVWLTQPTFGIIGYVILGNNMLADEGIVRLMAMDTLWQNVIEVESVMIDSGGFYNFSNVSWINTSLYFVQAELTEGSLYYGDYLPTYHLNSLSWETALPVFPMANWTADIFMIPTTAVSAGNGVISGSVTNLGTRGFMEGVLVVLLDENMNPVRYARSAENGTFSFTDLPMGTYIIHAEIMGIHTNQATVILSEDQEQVSLEIQVTGGESNVVYGIGEQHPFIEKVSEVYPNPVSSNSMIEFTLKERAQVRMTLISQAGANLSEESMNLSAGTHHLRIAAEGLPSGLYMLRISTAGGETVIKKFIKH